MGSLPILARSALLAACPSTEDDPTIDAGEPADSSDAGSTGASSSLSMNAGLRYTEAPFSDEVEFAAYVMLIDDDGAVGDATVTVNGTPLPYDPLFQYSAPLAQAAALGIAPGARVIVRAERGSESLEMEVACPSPEILSPSEGTAYLPGTPVEVRWQPAIVNSDGAGYSVLESTRYVASTNEGVAVTGSVDSVEGVVWLEVGGTSATVDMPAPWIESEHDYAVSLEYLSEDVIKPNDSGASRLVCMVVRRIHLTGIAP